MTDGRVFTPEDELDVLHEDLGRARRALFSLERAPYEGRVTDVRGHERSVYFARQRVAELERELASFRCNPCECGGICEECAA